MTALAKGLVTILIITTVTLLWMLWPVKHVPDTIWRYRISISVETPEGVKTGSAVREVIYGGSTEGGGGPGLSLKCRGEAVIVDLGKRGVLFSLTGRDDCTDIILKVFNGEQDKTLRPASVPQAGKVSLSEVRLSEYIKMVTYSDLSDPQTVKSVDFRQLSRTFGEDVSLKSVTVEITDEPITRLIKSYLPWMDTQPVADLPETYLTKGDFIREDN